MTVHRLEKHTSEYLNVIAPNALVVIPVGSTEQHGPHLPIGCDSFNIQYLSEQAAIKTRNPLVLVAPTLWYGSSHHHLAFSGTMSLRGSTLLAILCDLGNSLAAGGFKKIFFLSGHGGNRTMVREADRMLVNEENRDIIVGAAYYGEILQDVLMQIKVANKPGHAGTFETSLQMTLDETLVDEKARKALVGGTFSSAQYRPVDQAERDILRFKSLGGKASYQRHEAFRKFGGVSDRPGATAAIWAWPRP